MKKTIIFSISLLIALLSLSNLYGQKLTPQQMTDRAVLGLKGDVKSVVYNNTEKYTFNENGYILSEPIYDSKEDRLKHYVSDKRYSSDQNFYDIKYTSNTRKDQLEITGEDLYTMYSFDKQGRIIEVEEFGYSSSSKTYKYTKNEDLIYQKLVFEGWEEGTFESTETYTYTEKDEKGNWTKRKVKKVAKESEYDYDNNKYIDTKNESKEYLETAKIVYYSSSEAQAQAQYMSEEDATNRPSRAEAETPYVPLKNRIPVWLMIVFTIVGAILAYLMTYGYNYTSEFLYDTFDIDFLPRKPILNYITIIGGIAISSYFFFFDLGTQQEITIVLGALGALLAIGVLIIFLRNKSDKKLALKKSIYFVVSSIVCLLISAAVTVVLVWVVMIAAFYFIFIKLILGTLTKSSIKESKRSSASVKSEKRKFDGYSQAPSFGGRKCKNCSSYSSPGYCSHLNEQVSGSGSCNNFYAK